MNYRKRPRAVIPPRPSSHTTTKSLWLKRTGRLFEKQGQEISFKHTTSFVANDISSVSGKGGMNSAYASDCYICCPMRLPFQVEISSIC